ncbi:MAG: ROK family protein [Pseudonocardia sp.]|nr:ROK family protein [Pseudonocardia sp.]
MRRIGIDVGGTGIKGAVVDLASGAQYPWDYRATPTPATPDAVATAVVGMVDPWECGGRLGIALPFTLDHGIAATAGNISPEWIGRNAEELFAARLGRKVVVLNDTDAAGIAEARYGTADHPGTVLVLTFGTGIGSAVLHGGKLEPNTELGHLHVDGQIADGYVSLSALRTEHLRWPEWIGRANRFLEVVEQDHYDLIVIGGGLTHEAAHWAGKLVTRAPLRHARFFNRAGVIGAALAAEHGVHEVFRRSEQR